MRKFLSLVLVLLMVFSMTVVASAESTTTLTTTVPAATYTLNIPADQEIPFGTTKTELGNVTVTESSGFAVGKNLKVTVTYDAFKCADTTTEIPFELNMYAQGGSSAYRGTLDVPSGSAILFEGLSSGNVNQYVQMLVYNTVNSGSPEYTDADCIELTADSSDWGKALAGEYTATITFTAEVVVE